MIANLKTISLVLAINVAAGGAFAITAQNTALDSSVAYKTNMFSGYNVTGIVFDLNDSDPTFLDAVTFKIAPNLGATQANHVVVQTEADGAWTECALVDDALPARTVTCTFKSLPVEDVTALNIVAK